ncbi:MAG: right-handed parallel beta-helix repeat-containing protein [Lentisphaeraceae bacterium]|nr:right-handed parallel beta-helix repeat-containing protein [Lentisphaeraceae bacterium]
MGKLNSKICIFVSLLLLTSSSLLAKTVTNADELIKAISQGKAGDTIELAAGTYELKASLKPKAKMQIKGAGVGKTIIKSAASWKPGKKGLPNKDNPQAYLFNFDKADGLKISHMSLYGPTLHGAIYGRGSTDVEFHNLHIENFFYSGIRSFVINSFRIHDCTFHNAGGTVKHQGGAMYLTWSKKSEFWNNRITKSKEHSHHYGIKGRGIVDSRIHHNTILINFSIEFPFENDKNTEIDHNYVTGTLSLPKHAGGMKINEGEHSFHIHHNYSSSSYAIELPRNNMEVNHNLFDFKTTDDKGNLLCNFSKANVPGYIKFHNNLVMNPGRGLFWTHGPHENIHFYNNHVKANTLTRKDGFIGIHGKSNFSNTVIKDNIFECNSANPRPLLRNDASYRATIENNSFENVTDTDKFKNPQTGKTKGLTEPLKFKCGVNGEYSVDQWTLTPPKK